MDPFQKALLGTDGADDFRFAFKIHAIIPAVNPRDFSSQVFQSVFLKGFLSSPTLGKKNAMDRNFQPMALVVAYKVCL
jgi:hypothetical protein